MLDERVTPPRASQNGASGRQRQVANDESSPQQRRRPDIAEHHFYAWNRPSGRRLAKRVLLAHSPVAHERSQPKFHREAGTHQAEVRRRPNHCPAHRCSDQPWTVPEVVRQEQEPTRHEFWVQQVDPGGAPNQRRAQ